MLTLTRARPRSPGTRRRMDTEIGRWQRDWREGGSDAPSIQASVPPHHPASAFRSSPEGQFGRRGNRSGPV